MPAPPFSLTLEADAASFAILELGFGQAAKQGAAAIGKPAVGDGDVEEGNVPRTCSVCEGLNGWLELELSLSGPDREALTRLWLTSITSAISINWARPAGLRIRSGP